jgi:uncharacterized protein YgfB (UPF0149 family)
VNELELLALEAVAGPEQGLTPAELHGATVGIGVADAERFELQDLVDLLGADALSDAETVSQFVAASMDVLHMHDMSFALLLPDDDAEMADRLSALSDWCQSFLAGLVAGLNRRGIEELNDLPEEVGEIVRDFAAIAQLDSEPGEDDGEADFVELEEYAKVGALLIMSLTGEKITDAGDYPEE